MDKDIVVKKYIEFLHEQLKLTNKNFENAKKDMIEAEGRMVTRYDSTKTEVAWIANSLLVKKQNLESAIERKNIDNVLKVMVGSKVKVRHLNKDNDQNIFELLIGKSKKELDNNIIQLDTTSDNVKALFGKIKEDIVELNLNNVNMVVKIEEISNSIEENIVNLDAIVLMEDEDGYEDYYYICDSEGGVELELDDGTEVIVVSNKAPIGLQMLGKKINDEVVLKLDNRESRFIIKDII
ncbi:MAG: GreA/GreB family elongation factor [Bacilli bacterium]|nr:GreA/GreB family elongation factor [Bacilli bacterium]